MHTFGLFYFFIFISQLKQKSNKKNSSVLRGTFRRFYDANQIVPVQFNKGIKEKSENFSNIKWWTD